MTGEREGAGTLTKYEVHRTVLLMRGSKSDCRTPRRSPVLVLTLIPPEKDSSNQQRSSVRHREQVNNVRPAILSIIFKTDGDGVLFTKVLMRIILSLRRNKCFIDSGHQVVVEAKYNFDIMYY